jgi:hypothetical protein
VRPEKIDDKDMFQMNAKLLAQRSYLITDIEDGNNPQLTQNVRLLRDFDSDKVRYIYITLKTIIDVI